MNRRSRKGCIDCKRAKVKCDEVQPTCGTCRRRGYECQGYASTRQRPDALVSPIKRRHEDNKLQSRHSVRRTIDTRRASRDDSHQAKSSSQSETFSRAEPVSGSSHPLSSERNTTRSSTELTRQNPQLCHSIPLVPSGTVRSIDEPALQLYFQRHPFDQVLSVEFVDEMNSNVLKVFHQDPAAVADSLSAIGHIYLNGKEKSRVSILDRRARILSRLREKHDLEQILCLLLGLCALEMIDNTTPPENSILPTLIANTAMIIGHHRNEGKSFSSIAKYFIRAVARQDMMLALAYSRPPLIPNSVWLDEECQHHADRFMGYTGTLMPILADLSVLAHDVRTKSSNAISDLPQGSVQVVKSDEDEAKPIINDGPESKLWQRASDIRAALHQWQPICCHNASFKSSKNLLFHAHAYKAAALLYLHRITNAAGHSEQADRVALGMAHGILMHLSSISDQLKTTLWPLFVAACELRDLEDRTTAIQLFDEIYRLRRTVTTSRTKEFCVDRVWKARDAGNHWNWGDLVHQYPGECFPI